MSYCGSALEVVFHDYALYKSTFTLLYFELIIGAETRAAVVKLTDGAQQEVYEDIIQFYITAFQYLTTKLPCLHEDLYKYCEVADVQLHVSAKFSSVLYFVEKHSCLLGIEGTSDNVSLDKLQTEFTQYQTAVDLPQADRVDVQWHMISQMQDMLGNFKYKHLARVMSAILAVPHSNADCERVFSLVRKSRIEARSSMTSETLESLLIQKVTAVHSGPCYSVGKCDVMVGVAKSVVHKQKTANRSMAASFNVVSIY